MNMFHFFITMSLASYVVIAAPHCPSYRFTVFSDTAPGARGISSTVQSYRSALGGIDNLSGAGPLSSGHRSINWDAAVVPFDMPGNFFDATVTRGAIFSARGNTFAVSNPSADPAHPKPEDNDDRFSSLLPFRQSRQFRRFSRDRLFTPVNNNRVTVTFNVPAQGEKAAVTGFGAVFTDVDLPRQTFMQYFDKNGCEIAKVMVPQRNKGLSFVGIAVHDPSNGRKLIPVVARVLVKMGNVRVSAAASRGEDVVVMDDLIYGEPQKIAGWYTN